MIGDPARFAVPADACRSAFDLVAGWLPPGFIGPDVFPAWCARFRAGEVRFGDIAADLPSGDRWPQLEPRCFRSDDPDPRSAFLHTLGHNAHARHSLNKLLQVPGIGFVRTSGVNDDRTTDLHRHRHGLVIARSSAVLEALWRERVWSCRCVHVGMFEAMARRRGWPLIDQSDRLRLGPA